MNRVLHLSVQSVIAWSVLLLVSTSVVAQSNERDQEMIQRIFDQALTDDKAYEWLRYLTQNIGGRLSGSVQAEQAVSYTYDQLRSMGLDRVEKQPVMVPKWVRGPKEYAYFETETGKTTSVPVCALG